MSVLLALGLIFLLLLSAAGAALAQVYVEGGKTRHRFAQLTLGTELRYFPGAGTETTLLDAATGTAQRAALGAQSQACFVIGGTHFWGHADFYVAVPLLSMGQGGFRSGVETAAKYYPWRIQDRKLRPYLGAGWQPTGYRQGEGASQHRHEWPILAGITFNRRNLLIELGAAYTAKPSLRHYVSPAQQADVRTHPLRLSLGVKWMLETTLPAEKDWQSGRTKILTDTLAKLGRLNSFTVAVGPSAAMFLQSSSHNEGELSFLHQHNSVRVFPEFGLGYYLHKPDVQFNLAYRSISSRATGFGHEQAVNRKALTLEAYKFFADYHGFVPFVGPALSAEWLSLRDQSPQQGEQRYARRVLRPGLTFGWDIRPNRLQYFYLRTNLRWFPNLDLPTTNGRVFSFDQLEFNFIQLVVMLDRVM